MLLSTCVAAMKMGFERHLRQVTLHRSKQTLSSSVREKRIKKSIVITFFIWSAGFYPGLRVGDATYHILKDAEVTSTSAGK